MRHWRLYIEITDSDGWTEREDIITMHPHALTPMWSRAIPFLDIPAYFHEKKCADIFWLLKVGLNDIMDNWDAYHDLETETEPHDFDQFFREYVHLIKACAQNPNATIKCGGLSKNEAVSKKH